MEEKYISKEVFEARMDVFEEKINSLAQNMSHMSDQLEVIAGISKQVVEHEKDIQSVRRETERNRERLRQLESNQSKIVWAIISAFLTMLVQFALNGGFIIKK